MKIFLLSACLAGALTVAWLNRPVSVVEATVTTSVIVAGVETFGMNLGNWTAWGAEQLSANVIKNPGFEGLIDGAIAIPTHNGIDTFDDSPKWLAREDGFWEGAAYTIRAGQEAGQAGHIVHSLKAGPAGLPSFTVHHGDPVPDFGSSVALVKDTEDMLPSQWWYSRGAGNSFSPAPGQTRPGSPGNRALRIGATGDDPAEVASYFDTISDRSGKMLLITGEWKLSFWVKAEDGDPSLKIVLRRGDSVPFLSREVPVSAQWRNVELTFQGQDDAPPATLSLRFQMQGRRAGHLLLDDVDLRKLADAGRPFRAEVVNALRALHPGYLRDWQGQLGDTLENRIAPAFARKAYRYRPGTGDTQTDFGYGIGDFLELASEVGAAPWIIIPPTFSDAECAGLGDYLARQKFPAAQQVLLEFANESWNDIFRAAGIPDPYMYSQAADRCFAAARAHASGVRIRTVIGTQFANPASVAAYAAESRGADIVAVAPYFAYSIPARLSLAAGLPLLFESNSKKLAAVAGTAAARRKELAVYEINLHSINGDATPDERVPVVAGMASGTALARTMLDSLAHGIRRQCVYVLTGFDATLTSRAGLIPLWGVMRDVGSTRRFRPTGLALQMMNRVLQGDMLEVKHRGPEDVSLYAFSTAAGTSVVAISGGPVQRQIFVQLPGTVQSNRPLQMMRLTAASLSSTNEDREDVRIGHETAVMRGNRLSLLLEPWSMAVITPLEETRP